MGASNCTPLVTLTSCVTLVLGTQGKGPQNRLFRVLLVLTRGLQEAMHVCEYVCVSVCACASVYVSVCLYVCDCA